MKLINSLYYLINEINLGTDKMLPLITIFQKNDDLIRLYSTIHQSKERHGSETLKQIKKRYHDNELRNPVNFDRVGVPKMQLQELFCGVLSTYERMESSQNIFAIKNFNIQQFRQQLVGKIIKFMV